MEAFRGKLLSVHLLENGYEVVDHAPAVAVVALREGKLLCVRQFRHAIGSMTVEIPAGLIEPGEEPAAAAQRELAEECQLGGQLELLARYYPSPGFCNEELWVFSASELAEAEGEPDQDEELEVLWVAPEELLAGLRSGQIAGSSTTLIGTLWALR